MTNTELIDRYVYAVIRRLPTAIQKDVDSELRGLISDMLDERCGDVLPTETDVKVVLTELGSPYELAAKYDPKGERSLIGPKYYRPYLRVLTIVCISAVCGVTIAQVLELAAGEMTGLWYQIVAEFLGTIWSTLLQAAAIVTLIFAIFERKNVDLDHASDDLSRLPSVPEDKERTSRTESIIGIVFGVIIFIMLMFFPDTSLIFRFSVGDGQTDTVRLFQPNAFDSVWYLLVLSFGASIVLDCIKLIVGRYNLRIAITATVCNIITAVLTPIILLRDGVLDNEGIRAVADIITENSGSADNPAALFFTHFLGVICAIVVICSAADIVKCWVKAIKYKA